VQKYFFVLSSIRKKYAFATVTETANKSNFRALRSVIFCCMYL